MYLVHVEIAITVSSPYRNMGYSTSSPYRTPYSANVTSNIHAWVNLFFRCFFTACFFSEIMYFEAARELLRSQFDHTTVESSVGQEPMMGSC